MKTETKLGIALMIFVFGILILIHNASAEIQSLGSAKQGDSINLIQGCKNSTYSNIVSVLFPDKSFALYGNYSMTKNINDYNYSFENTSIAGQYIVSGNCNENGLEVPWTYDFYITSTGSQDINTGQGMSLIGSMLVILVISAFFFILGMGIENVGMKIVLIGLASIGLITAVLFSLLTATQVLSNYPDLIEGITTFWFVLKILTGIALTGLVLFSLYFAWNSWMKYRGFRD